ncbi:MAG: ferritin family protein [Myxococcales bacterium]
MTTKGIDFATLSLKDALDLAVLIEEEARERYEEFADQMQAHHTPEAAHFFRFMAGNEEKHRLELAAQRRDLFRDAPTAVTRQMIFDVEAPDYDEARAFMTAREALQAAFRAEKKAYAFFNEALPRVHEPQVKALFEELRGEEIQHQRLVLAELEKTPPDPALTADDFADDPVAQ